MKTEERIIKNTHIQLNTSLPLYSESYEFSCSEDRTFHSHEFLEIGITLEGAAIHCTNDGRKLISRGSVYMIPIGESHSVGVPKFWHVQNLYILPKLIFQSLNINNLADPILNQFFLKLMDKEFHSIINLNLSASALKDIQGLIKLHEKISLSNKQLLEHFHSNCLLNILMILCETYYERYPSKILNTDERTHKIIALIYENIYSSTGDIIKNITEKLELHPQYINKIVKKSLNITLSNLILETKIEKSCELLLNNYSITETAQALAFYDHSHYNKYFIRYFGISPSQYRAKYSKSN